VRVESALETSDYPALLALTGEHQEAMDALEATGPCSDSNLLNLLIETRDRIENVANLIRSYRDTLAKQINIGETRKKLNTAYKR
jgi:hypothetical protein